MPETKTERHCPACGRLHSSSLVPEAEMVHLEPEIKLSALPKATVYRVFRCGDAFHPVPHEGSEPGGSSPTRAENEGS